MILMQTFKIINIYKVLISGTSCDECVVAGQNAFPGPTAHLPRPECCVESHHLRLIRQVYRCFWMRFRKRH